MVDSAWAKALAAVFVEPQRTDDANPVRQRHLAAVSSSKVFRAPALVVVSLIQRATRVELATIVDGAQSAAQNRAKAIGESSGRIVLGGIEAPRRRNWNSKSNYTAVAGSQFAAAVKREQPEVVVVDAARFQALPANWLVGAAIAGIGRDGDGAAYTGLFALETRARFPEAKVWAGSIDELTAARGGKQSVFSLRRRSPGEGLADGLIGLLSE